MKSKYFVIALIVVLFVVLGKCGVRPGNRVSPVEAVIAVEGVTTVGRYDWRRWRYGSSQ